MEIPVLSEVVLTEEVIQTRADKLSTEISDEELAELGMDRAYFKEMLISFGQSYGKPAVELDMSEIENMYLELTGGA